MLDGLKLALQAFCMATATHHLIEMSLKGRTLRSLVTKSRKAGNSWQSIANQIHEATGIAVSRETLRSWYPELAEPAQPKAATA